MRHSKAFGPHGFLLVCLFLSASASSRQGMQAQTQTTPATGTTVVVRMIGRRGFRRRSRGEAVPRLVAKPVNADNGITIAQGAAAIITLARIGSDWVAQLSSVVINGQAVAVTSSSASVSQRRAKCAGKRDERGELRSRRIWTSHECACRRLGRCDGPASRPAAGDHLTFVLSQPPRRRARLPPAARSAPRQVSRPVPQPRPATVPAAT